MINDTHMTFALDDTLTEELPDQMRAPFDEEEAEGFEDTEPLDDGVWPDVGQMAEQADVSPTRKHKRRKTYPITSDITKDYFKQVGFHHLLSAEEERVLGEKVKKGAEATERLANHEAGIELLSPREYRDLMRVAEEGRVAREEFISSNLRLVVSIARGYLGRNVQLMDLIAEGNQGLITAVDKFNYTLGYRFSTYATWWIRQAICRCIPKLANAIKLSQHTADNIRKIEAVKSRLLMELGREATTAEIAQELGQSEEWVSDLVETTRVTASLETPVGEDGNAELGDFFADVTAESAFDAVDKADLSEALHKALATLTDRERQIIIFHYGLNNTACHTLVEIGNMFHLSRERIRQIEAEALTKLRLGDHMQLAAYA